MTGYAFPKGGLPGQANRTKGRAMFTEAYVVVPGEVMSDIVTSFLPGWTNMRMWVLARPLSGFAETFSQYSVEVDINGGTDRLETDDEAQGVLFVLDGSADLTLDGQAHKMTPGSYVYYAPGADMSLWNTGDEPIRFAWVRKKFVEVDGLDRPESFVTHETDVPALEMPHTDGAWATTRFVDPTDLRHDMHVNIVTLRPGASIPFEETHVMEHGIYVLQGSGIYLLNQDWMEVDAGDFLWLRAFCPQGCYATGKTHFKYLLYKDVNRHMPLSF